MAEGRNAPQAPIRVLFVNDHLGLAAGVTHGSTTYLSTVLPAFDRGVVEAGLCICRSWHSAADRFESLGVPLTFLGRHKWDPRVLTDLISKIRRERIDIVHLNGKKSHLLGRLAARATGRRAIVHVHMVYQPRPRWLQPWLARGTHAALGVSKATRELAVSAFAIPRERTHVLYNGLAIERFAAPPPGTRQRVRRELGIDDDTSVIGVVGRITRTPDKGQRMAVEAMPAVLARQPDSVMLVVGDGPARAEVESRAAELGLDDRVWFLGHRAEVAELYAAADITVVPSLVDEALGYSAVESIAAGRPVVAFDGGGIPEVVLDGSTGWVVPSGDVQAMAAAMVRLLGDPGERERMGREGREHAGTFELSRHVAFLTDLYRRLAG